MDWLFFSDNDDGAVGDHGGNDAEGSKPRCDDETGDSDGDGYVEQYFFVFIFDDDAGDVTFVNEFFDGFD